MSNQTYSNATGPANMTKSNSTGQANTTKPKNASGFENDNAIASDLKNALNYTGGDGEKFVREVKWANLLIGIMSAIILMLAVGIGMYFLLKYHKKKLLAGLHIEEGKVTTYATSNPMMDEPAHKDEKVDRFD